MTQDNSGTTTSNKTTVSNKSAVSYKRTPPPTPEEQALESRLNTPVFDLMPEETRGFEFFLTTEDNPFVPFVDFDNWFAFDRQRKYNSLNLLARIAKLTDNLGEIQTKFSIVQAMHDIVRLNISGKHRILVRHSIESTP